MFFVRFHVMVRIGNQGAAIDDLGEMAYVVASLLENEILDLFRDAAGRRRRDPINLAKGRWWLDRLVDERHQVTAQRRAVAIWTDAFVVGEKIEKIRPGLHNENIRLKSGEQIFD